MLIKGQGAEFVEIKILGRENHASSDYWDGNWLNGEVKIETSHFTANYGTNFRAEDFSRFYDDIVLIKNHNVDEITFATMEEGLSLHLKLQRNGSIVCSGQANSSYGDSLKFQFSIDSMVLDSLADQIKNIVQKYPVIGSPK